MSEADILLFLLLSVSAIFSAFTGLVRTAARLLALAAAVYLAVFHSGLLNPAFIRLGASASAAHLMSVATLVICSLVAGHVTGRMLEGFVNFVGLRGLNMLLGLCYGALRGFALVAVVVVACAHYGIVLFDPYWHESYLLRGTGYFIKQIGTKDLTPSPLKKYLKGFSFSEDCQPMLANSSENSLRGSSGLTPSPLKKYLKVFSFSEDCQSMPANSSENSLLGSSEQKVIFNEGQAVLPEYYGGG